MLGEHGQDAAFEEDDMTQRMTIQNQLVEYVRHQAEWRGWKAEEHPEDERNIRSAAGLNDLAKYVESLPFDDARVLQMEAWVNDYNAFISPGPDTAREISRFRFDDPGRSKEAFLDWLLDALVRDQSERIEEEKIWDSEA